MTQADPVPAGECAPAPTGAGRPARLASVDALRGFDMFWIAGGDMLVHAIANATGARWANALAWQMDHAGWTGFRCYDLIFPLFLFLAGVSIPLALGRKLADSHPRRQLAAKAAIRALALVALGVVYNGGLALKPLAQTRVCSVLGLIGIAWFCAALVYLFVRPRQLWLWAGGILLGYWAILEWCPVPGHGPGLHTPAGSITSFIDQLLPWHPYTPLYDPEGLLQSLAATFVALAGCLTGRFLDPARPCRIAKPLVLAAAGLVALGAGALVGLAMEISKPMWNPPFMLTCVGWSLLLLAAFHWLVDGIGLRAPALPLIIIGMNPITLYLLLRMVPMDDVSRFFFGGMIGHCPPHVQPVLAALAYIATWWILLVFLYRRRIFLSV